MNIRLLFREWIKPGLLRTICFLTLQLQLIAFNSSAQYSKLMDFGSPVNGGGPLGTLVSDGTFLYGMASFGGITNYGTIFKIMPDGTGYTRLLAFDGAGNGSNPQGSLIYDGTFLYGMTQNGGMYGEGTIFKIMPDGNGYAKLWNFESVVTGGSPVGSLISDGTFLYGMTLLGGLSNDGTVFKIKHDGTGFEKLLDFDTDVIGGRPDGSLISVGTFLYGMTANGGTNGNGTIFKIMPDGNGFQVLLNFDYDVTGSSPLGSLISDGTFLYGMTYDGGTNGDGTIFKIMPDGGGYAKLLDFAGATDGQNPRGSLISDGTFLYGMTRRGGTNDEGTIFKIMPNGSGFTTLSNFAGNPDGGNPHGDLISVGTFLYGMTSGGGMTSGFITNGGTIFKIMPNGTGYGKLLDFSAVATGGSPLGSLISDGTFLYGLTENYGTNSGGTIFKVKPDGTGYAQLLNFVRATTGSLPTGTLISDGTFLYGMNRIGGTNDLGTIFKIMPDGTGFVKLLDFAGATNGQGPLGSLFSDGTFLYGMTVSGGTNGFGTIFKIMPNGSGYVKLLDFAGAANGTSPYGSLFSDGTFLYGMTRNGGTNGFGTIFKIMPNGTGYTKMLDFAGAANGREPQGDLISDGTFLYGMTSSGGAFNNGTIFKIMPDGTGYAKLFDFEAFTDGGTPRGSLISDGTFLYGMTAFGGTNSDGIIFKIMPNGTGFQKLLDFAGIIKGAQPQGSLISDGTLLYGMTRAGGSASTGTVFKYSLAPTLSTITSFAPLFGAVGTTVTITGTTFSSIPANNIVRFGATRATVSVATSTQLTVTVPAGATFEPISATVGGLTAYSPKPFIPTFTGGSAIGATSFGAHVDFATPAPAISVCIGDLDLDGLADMVVSSQLGTTGIISVFRNTSTPGAISAGSFAAPVNFTESDEERAGMAIADIDGDGKPEIIALDVINDRVLVYRNLTLPGTINAFSFDSRSFDVGSGDSPINVDVEDLDADGRPEIVTANFGQDRISIIKNNSTFGSILFEPRIYIPTGEGPVDIAIRDFNNDGKPDLAIANQSENTVSVFENQTTPGLIDASSFAGVVNFAVGSSPTRIAIGDIDGDGKQDLVTANLGSNNISILRNQITAGSINPGSFSSSANFTTGGPTNSIALGDLNGDGKIDIGTAINTGATGVVVLQNSSAPGDFTLDPLVGFSAGAGTFEVAIGDIDGDGRPEIATANNTGQSASILQGTTSSPTITITLQPNDATVCVGTVATFITAATGTSNITFQWQFSTDGIAPYVDITNGSGYSNVTTATLSVNTTGSFGAGRYRCRINGDGAPEIVTSDKDLSINSFPAAPATSGNSGCTSTSILLTATGASPGEFRWYTVATGGTAISGAVNGTYATPALAATTNFYAAINNGACEGSRTVCTATIIPLPAAPGTAGDSGCSATSITVTATGGVDGQYRWYTVATGGTAITGEVNSAYTTSPISTTIYYVAINDGICESPRTAVTATISATPSTPATTPGASCGPGAVTLSASGGTDGEYRWYTTATGGTPITSEVNSAYTTSPILTTTIYYVAINNGICESPRTAVTATINVTPATPATTPGASCGPGAVTLSASGGTNGEYRWYTTAIGGTPIAGEVNSSYTTPSISTSTTYYVSINDGACESPRQSVLAQVNPLPAPPSTTGASGVAPVSLTLTAAGASNGQYRWYNVATGGTFLPGEVNGTYTTPVLTSPTTYFVSINNSTCESLRTPVLADIKTNQAPVIANTSTQTTVEGTVSLDLTSIISDPDGNLDFSTLSIVTPPTSGAIASIDAQFNLDIDYSGVAFSGTDRVTIGICDVLAACSQQELTVEVIGDITVFNAVSPNGDTKNEVLYIQYIDILPDTQNNRVTIYNRWGDVVFETQNYDNANRAFRGQNKNGDDLPPGTYYYKIAFANGNGSKTGFISLKR